MRMMLKFTLPVERGNAAISDGMIAKTVESIMSELKPEAAYFGPTDGKRGGMVFFDLAEPSQIVEVVEPLFLNLNAATELVPVMNAGDLRKGLERWSHSLRQPAKVNSPMQRTDHHEDAETVFG